ncbi:MAG: exo-alpha-sialidase [Clostridiales bacterium]|nr:exo-alpha-sialidase [Clostridiales bacterium]
MEVKQHQSALRVQYTSVIDKAPKLMKHHEGKTVYNTASLYGRLIRISHSSQGHNGVLISTFEHRKLDNDPKDTLGRMQGHPVYRSDDDGKSWRMVARILDWEHPHFNVYWMPTIYELPRDMGSFPKGTLIMGAVSTHPEEGSYLRLYYSLNTGSTWFALGTLDHGGHCGKGVWEPFFTMTDDGVLVCHYCDERNCTIHSQKLIYRITRDLENWSFAMDSVACEDPNLRPGMPVVTRLPDGRYFMVYEMVGMEGNPIYCRYSPDGLDWGDPRDPGRRIYSNQGGSLGSSPYCLWVNRGGEKGTLIVSGAFMSAGMPSGGHANGTDYFVSYDLGETFEQWPHPIPYKDSDHASHTGYSNSYFFCDEESKLYSINNPGSKDGICTEMTMAVSLWEE